MDKDAFATIPPDLRTKIESVMADENWTADEALRRMMTALEWRREKPVKFSPSEIPDYPACKRAIIVRDGRVIYHLNRPDNLPPRPFVIPWMCANEGEIRCTIWEPTDDVYLLDDEEMLDRKEMDELCVQGLGMMSVRVEKIADGKIRFMQAIGLDENDEEMIVQHPAEYLRQARRAKIANPMPSKD